MICNRAYTTCNRNGCMFGYGPRRVGHSSFRPHYVNGKLRPHCTATAGLGRSMIGR